MIRVFESLADARGEFGPCALTIGNFDGTHLGHQMLFDEVAAIAQREALKAAVLTFTPHPAKIVAPARAPALLTTFAQRIEVMERHGIEYVLNLPFTMDTARLTPGEFAAGILAGALEARAVVVGDNFRFGHKQAGDIATLIALGTRFGFTVTVVGALARRQATVSSTAIRECVLAGEMNRACRMLGRPYSLRGEVVRGHGIGSKQTVPTVNLDTPAELIPLSGVYITRTRDLEDGRIWNSITNIGTRPTFEGDRLSIETFLLTPFDGATPHRIELELLRRVREERKFPNAESLKAQILRDAARSQAYHRRRDRLRTL